MVDATEIGPLYFACSFLFLPYHGQEKTFAVTATAGSCPLGPVFQGNNLYSFSGFSGPHVGSENEGCRPSWDHILRAIVLFNWTESTARRGGILPGWDKGPRGYSSMQFAALYEEGGDERTAWRIQ